MSFILLCQRSRHQCQISVESDGNKRRRPINTKHLKAHRGAFGHHGQHHLQRRPLGVMRKASSISNSRNLGTTFKPTRSLAHLLIFLLLSVRASVLRFLLLCNCLHHFIAQLGMSKGGEGGRMGVALWQMKPTKRPTDSAEALVFASMR